MTVEKIARSIERLRSGNIQLPPYRVDDPVKQLLLDTVSNVQQARMRAGWTEIGEVVDVTAIYRQFVEAGEPVMLYGDSMMAPPLTEATYCFYDDAQGFVAMLGASTYQAGDELFERFKWTEDQRVGADHTFDWADVKWLTVTALWLDNPRLHQQVVGPVMSWRLAINAEGTTLDVNWVQMTSAGTPNTWDDAIAVFIQAVTWMNCRNIELVEPRRPRPQQRRLARLTSRPVKEIHVRPIGKTYQYEETRRVGDSAIPLHRVRGHIAKYGIDGRKKLFGKITGRFWIPDHARGSAEHGETHNTRVLETS